MAILSLETSTSVCSAALHENGNLLTTKELYTPFSAGAQLAVQIEELFSVIRIPKRDLKAIAVSAGPGSYTGLRIGVATAKGIGFALGVPLLSIDSLLVLAAGLENPSSADLLCPMIDARRMEVYYRLLDTSLNTREETQSKVIDETSFQDSLRHHSILFFGNGASKCRGYIINPRAFFLENVHPRAASMGKLAFQKFQARQVEDLETFEPTYLKDFVAKTKSA